MWKFFIFVSVDVVRVSVFEEKIDAANGKKIAPAVSHGKNAMPEIIKEIVHENHPNKAFSQLLNRWAQKHKQDFLLDSFNTLVFLACNPEQSNQNLSPHLLLKSCDFTIKPPGKKA